MCICSLVIVLLECGLESACELQLFLEEKRKMITIYMPFLSSCFQDDQNINAQFVST